MALVGIIVIPNITVRLRLLVISMIDEYEAETEAAAISDTSIVVTWFSFRWKKNEFQMDALAASLRELSETVKALPQEITPAHHTMIMKHVAGRTNDADVSLASSQAHFHIHLILLRVMAF
ncbi:unnamed protein product [Brugia pahangi]|uniref:BTB domain-containing protein n=1 Tax=Brugia pahangi TaxID=6280 RepID=A0A0N4TZ32_BRUPA|nr:unnamed protein product [Brugia pahangi]